MSTAIRDTITLLEQELDAIDQRRGEIQRAINTLQPLAGEAKPARGRAVQRERKVATRKPPVKSKKGGEPPVSASPRQRLEAVPARDAAIKAALRTGPKASSVLFDVLPVEPGQTPDQRDAALRNALNRLRLKKEIKFSDDGWALA